MGIMRKKSVKTTTVRIAVDDLKKLNDYRIPETLHDWQVIREIIKYYETKS